MREWEKIVPFTGPYTVHWSMLHRGNIMLRNDSAMNLSPDMYAEFGFPYDQALLSAFGGGAMHFCGRGDHWFPKASTLKGLHALAMSQPHLNDLDVIFRNTIEKGIKLLGFDNSAAGKALADHPARGNVHSGG
jgi:hypothetical protein